MKRKYIIGIFATILAVFILSATVPAFRILNYGVRVIGDFKIDSTFYL